MIQYIKYIMLAFQYRFHGHGSLRYVYSKGRALRSRCFTIKTTLNARRKYSRFAVVISKKVHKSAVGRNRMRRRIYEIIRNEIPSMKMIQDVVVIVSSAEVITIPSDDLYTQLTTLFADAGLYDDPMK